MPEPARQQAAATGDWPELPPRIAPPPFDIDELTPERIDALGFEGVVAAIVDAALREGLRPDTPPPLRETLRVQLLERMYEDARFRPYLPYLPEIPEPPVEQTQAEVEAEAERRLRWQEAWDARAPERQPSTRDVAQARATVLREIDRVARETLRELLDQPQA